MLTYRNELIVVEQWFPENVEDGRERTHARRRCRVDIFLRQKLLELRDDGLNDFRSESLIGLSKSRVLWERGLKDL